MPKHAPPIPLPQTNAQDSPLARRAGALMTQWVFERTDDQAAFSRMGAAAAGCITYATAVTLAIASRQPICASGEASIASHTCNTMPPAILVGAPLPLWFLFCSILIAIKGVQRRQPTIELLELEIGEINARQDPWPRHPSTRTDSAKTFYDLLLTRCVQVVMYGGALLVTITATIGALLLLFYVDDSLPLRATGIGVDALILAVVVPFAVKRPRNPHADILESLREQEARTPPPDAPTPHAGRSLGSYLLLPRPRYVLKWLFFPVCFGLAVWSQGGASGLIVLDAVFLWIALEYLIYPARYQWNDVRGFVDDVRHPDRKGRGRLPWGSTAKESRRIIEVSMATATARLLVAFAVGILRPHLLIPIVALIAAVFITGSIYEWLRTRKTIMALWVFVGVGYAIRGVAGLLAGGLSWNAPATIFGTLTLAALGTAFVTMTWALEALSHCEVTSSGVRYMYGLQKKPHLFRLLRFLDHDRTSAALTLTSTFAATDERLSGREEHGLRTRGALLAPWNFALVLSCLSGGIAGTALADPSTGQPAAVVAAAVVGVALAGLIILAPNTWSRSAVLLIGMPLFWTLGVVTDADDPLLLFMPFMVVGTVFIWFRAQSYDTLMAMAPTSRLLANAGGRLFSWAIGRQTWNAVGFGPRREAVDTPSPTGLED